MSTTATTEASTAPVVTGERADLLETLAQHRWLLRLPIRGLTDEQARQRTTVSQLCLGGVIKHVTWAEQIWAHFITDGPLSPKGDVPGAADEHERSFMMRADETLERLLTDYARVARDTDALVAALDDLDRARPLPPAPWFEPGAAWSARRALHHIIAETAQHAGHADIIREALDGAKSMG